MNFEPEFSGVLRRKQKKKSAIIKGKRKKRKKRKKTKNEVVLKYSIVPLGDVNGNGKVESADFILLTQYLAGDNVKIKKLPSDVNCDEKLDKTDVDLIMQYVAGSITSFPQYNTNGTIEYFNTTSPL